MKIEVECSVPETRVFRPRNSYPPESNPRSYRYYLTAFGKEIICAGLKFRELVLIPQLANATPA